MQNDASHTVLSRRIPASGEKDSTVPGFLVLYNDCFFFSVSF